MGILKIIRKVVIVCAIIFAVLAGGAWLLFYNMRAMVAVVDVPSGRVLAKWRPTEDAYAIALSPKGDYLAMGSYHKGVSVWRVSDRTRVSVFEVGPEAMSIAFSPDGSKIAAYFIDSRLQLWDALGKRMIWSQKIDGDGMELLCFAPDGQLVACVADNRLCLLSARNGKTVRAVLLPKCDSGWNQIGFSEGGKFLACANYDRIFLYGLSDGSLLKTFRAPPPFGYRGDSTLFAGATSRNAIARWDIATGRKLSESPVLDGGASVFSRGCETVLVNRDGSSDVVRLSDMKSLVSVGRLHSVSMTDASFSSDGNALAVSCRAFLYWPWR